MGVSSAAAWLPASRTVEGRPMSANTGRNDPDRSWTRAIVDLGVTSPTFVWTHICLFSASVLAVLGTSATIAYCCPPDRSYAIQSLRLVVVDHSFGTRLVTKGPNRWRLCMKSGSDKYFSLPAPRLVDRSEVRAYSHKHEMDLAVFGTGLPFTAFRCRVRATARHSEVPPVARRVYWDYVDGYATTASRQGSPSVVTAKVIGGWAVQRKSGTILIPFEPVWIGLLANFASTYITLTLIVFTARWMRRRWRRAKGRCCHCGYPVTPNLICPECGRMSEVRGRHDASVPD